MAPNDADMPDAYPLGDDLHKIAKDISGLREDLKGLAGDVKKLGGHQVENLQALRKRPWTTSLAPFSAIHFPLSASPSGLAFCTAF